MVDKKPGVIRRLFTFLGALIGWCRAAVVNIAFLMIIVVIFVVFSNKEMPRIPDQGALILEPKGSIVEQLSYIDPIVEILGESNPREQETRLQDIIDSINMAKDDERISTIVIKTDYLVHGGISKLQEVGTALAAFRESGKKVIAVADYYNQDQYFLAAQADEIYMNPMGGVLVQGFGQYRSYFKDALDKLSITFHVFRVGNFKSALEPFMRNDMSADAKQANMAWLSQLWDEYVNVIAERRQLSPQDVNRYVNDMDQLLAEKGGDSAEVALAAGLVNGLKSRDEINQYLIDVVGSSNDEGSFSGIDFEKYIWLRAHELTNSKSKTSNEVVGVLVAAGNIVNGKQPPGTIGGDTLSELIRQARNNDDVKAVVLRIDSGGGSAFASELIRRELELLKASGKPLVVSMGSMAASGGYWISALADSIWATPTTLTGSIGIFGAFPTIEKSLGQLGIHNDGVGTTKVAGALRVDRAMNPIAARSIQQSIEHGYEQFLDVVAQGRDMRREKVAEIAEGRVWSGKDAKLLGLVDEIGGLAQAIEQAAEFAELEVYDEQLIELPLSPKEQFLRQLGGVFTPAKLISIPSQLQHLLSPLSDSWQFVKDMNDPAGVYVHCTSCMEF